MVDDTSFPLAQYEYHQGTIEIVSFNTFYVVFMNRQQKFSDAWRHGPQDISSSLLLSPFRILWRSIVNQLVRESSNQQRTEYLERCWSELPPSRSEADSRKNASASLKLVKQVLTCKPEPGDWQTAASYYSQAWYDLTVDEDRKHSLRSN